MMMKATNPMKTVLSKWKKYAISFIYRLVLRQILEGAWNKVYLS